MTGVEVWAGSGISVKPTAAHHPTSHPRLFGIRPRRHPRRPLSNHRQSPQRHRNPPLLAAHRPCRLRPPPAKGAALVQSLSWKPAAKTSPPGTSPLIQNPSLTDQVRLPWLAGPHPESLEWNTGGLIRSKLDPVERIISGHREGPDEDSLGGIPRPDQRRYSVSISSRYREIASVRGGRGFSSSPAAWR